MIDRDQRECWLRARDRRGLVAGRPDYGRAGLMARLDEPRLLVTTLPADPLRPSVGFDDHALVSSVLPQQFTGRTANGVSLLAYEASTSAELVRFASRSATGTPWRAFAGVRADGGVDVAMGSVVRTEYQKGTDLAGVAGYRLFMLVHAARVAIETQARLCGWLGSDDLSPFEMIVALPGAGDCVLDGLADGWERPEYAFEVPQCLEQDPLIRIEVESWPEDSAGQETLLVTMADRICASFADRSPRYRPFVNGGPGELSRDYA